MNSNRCIVDERHMKNTTVLICAFLMGSVAAAYGDQARVIERSVVA